MFKKIYLVEISYQNQFEISDCVLGLADSKKNAYEIILDNIKNRSYDNRPPLSIIDAEDYYWWYSVRKFKINQSVKEQDNEDVKFCAIYDWVGREIEEEPRLGYKHNVEYEVYFEVMEKESFSYTKLQNIVLDESIIKKILAKEDSLHTEQLSIDYFDIKNDDFYIKNVISQINFLIDYENRNLDYHLVIETKPDWIKDLKSLYKDI